MLYIVIGAFYPGTLLNLDLPYAECIPQSNLIHYQIRFALIRSKL